jgi:hypothetical protein
VRCSCVGDSLNYAVWDASEMAVGLSRNSVEDQCKAYNSEWE